MPGLISFLILIPSLFASVSAPAPNLPSAAAVVRHENSERGDAIAEAQAAAAAQAAAEAQAAAAAAAAAAAEAARPRDLLVSEDGSLRVGLGVYSDCSGWSPVGRELAYMNICYGRTYFIGHNPGVFTPLMHMQPGDVITWYDGSAGVHRMKIVSVRVVSRFGGVPARVNPNVVAQFQTCEVLDGTYDRILDAEAA